jgi:hyperosmotically inducible protein
MRIGKLGSFLAVAALAAASVAYASGPAPVQKSLEERVRHEINMLPYYGVFDYLAFRVDGNRVTLLGQVWQPWLKQEAEDAVKHVEGIAQVDDQIEVLPLSSFDDRIRWQEVRAIYGYPALNRYGLGTHPSIHIIVKNGNVTLKGVVANTGDRQIAYMRANGVPGVFSVTNELQVDQS